MTLLSDPSPLPYIATVAFLLNLSNFFANKYTGPLTITVGGNLKQVVTIVLSIIIFRNPVSLLSAAGMSICTSGTHFAKRVVKFQTCFPFIQVLYCTLCSNITNYDRLNAKQHGFPPLAQGNESSKLSYLPRSEANGQQHSPYQ